MSKANPAASVRQRLLNISKERGELFDSVLTRYASERLLYRLSQSRHRDQFVLKGALLFAVWSPDQRLHRPTRDVDLLGFAMPEPAVIAGIFRDVASQLHPDDGLEFDLDSITAKSIREDNVYGGIRVLLAATLDRARIKVQVDVGFGDDITPGPESIELPCLLAEMPVVSLRGYPVCTVIAEKFEAIVRLGLENSRLKDYYDLWFLFTTFDLDDQLVRTAIARTFARRGTIKPDEIAGLGDGFAVTKARQWDAFVDRAGLQVPVALTEVTALLRERLRKVT